MSRYQETTVFLRRELRLEKMMLSRCACYLVEIAALDLIFYIYRRNNDRPDSVVFIQIINKIFDLIICFKLAVIINY